MTCCICRGVDIARRETQFNGIYERTTNVRKSFTFPDEITSEYQIKEIIGEGNTSVYRAKCNSTGEIVAIKVIIFPTQLNDSLSDDQFADIQKNNLEINILKNIDNINCIHLISYRFYRQKHHNVVSNILFLVTDYFNTSLHVAFSTKKFKFINNMTMIKIFSFQLFKGLSYLHNTVGIAHCDIKPSNLLFNEEDGILKICDFGNARVLKKKFSPQSSKALMNYISYSMIHSNQQRDNSSSYDHNYSDTNDDNSDSSSNDDNGNEIAITNNKNDFISQHIQTTMQYRAPEVLYECQNIDPAATDIWAAGCVIAEILRGNGKKLFSTSKTPSNTATLTKMPAGSSCTPIEQLTEIISILGQPILSDFENHEHAAIIISAKKTKSLEKILPRNTPKDLLALLKRIFVYCPEQRPTSDECLNSPFFDDIIERDDIQMPNGKKAPKLFR